MIFIILMRSIPSGFLLKNLLFSNVTAMEGFVTRGRKG